jgi:hypothetical protein
LQLQHHHWYENGRIFKPLDDLGQPIPYKWVEKKRVGQKNVLVDGQYYPYYWDKEKKILQYGTCEIRLTDSQVEFWQKDAKLLGASIHPEVQEASVWNRKPSTVSGLRVTEHPTEGAIEKATVAYDVETDGQKGTVVITVGGNNWARSAFAIEAKQAGRLRLTIAYDRKGTPIQDYDRGGKPLPIRRYNFGESIWSWLPGEQDDHALEQLTSVSELHLKEADYQATEVRKVSFDSFGPSETSDDCLEIYDYALYFDEYEGHVDCGNMDGTNRAHMGLIFSNVQASGTAQDGCKITFPVEVKGGSGCTANLGISNQDSPTPWSSSWLPSDCTLHGSVACNINATGPFDSPEIKTLIQYRFDDVDWDAGDSMAFPLLDNNSSSGNYVYCTSEESGDGAELTIVYSTGGATIEAEASDGFDVGETLAKNATVQGVAADGLKGGDSTAKIAQLFTAASDGAVMGDTNAAIVAFLMTAEDGISGGDTPGAKLTGFGQAAEGIKGGDTPGVLATLQGPASEGIKTGDAPSGKMTAGKEAADGFDAGDAAAKGFLAQGDTSDGMKTGDAAGRTRKTPKESTDGVEAGDTPLALGTFQGAAVDGLSFGEAITAAAILLAIAADGAKFGDTPLGDIVGALLGEAFDGMKMGDTPSVAGTFLKSVADGLKMGEALSALLTAIAETADGISYGDTPQGGLLTSALTQDGFKMGDALQRVLISIREASDGIAAGDSPAVNATFHVMVSDAVKMGEVLAALMTFYALASDGFEMSDAAFHITPGGPGEVTVTFGVGAAALTFTVKKGGIAFGAKAGKIEVN